MAKFQRIEVYNAIIKQGLVPLYYHPDIKVMTQVVAAVFEGGSRVFEFTNRGEGAHKVFEQLLEHCREKFPQLILGVGSVIDPGTGSLFISSGADFIVGSVFNYELGKLCNRLKIGYIPGCGTATEISTAEESGVEIVKVFPGSTVGGPKFVKSILAPTPWSMIMPTGGVTADIENLKAWFDAGVIAVGMGSALFQKGKILTGEYDEVRDLIKTVLKWIDEIREKN
jgi:2-dehydro-3-deoxyphosphogluconate aldolase/(4S)-4-hydroxy-2-oxoglutarate aldolase